MPTDILRNLPLPANARRVRCDGAVSGPRFVMIDAGGIKIRAELAATATAGLIWDALPLFSAAEPWGKAVHFELPVAAGRDRTARVLARLGDICFWCEEQRVIIPFGPTPISRAGEMRMPNPVNIIGCALDDVGALTGVRVGAKVSLSRLQGELVQNRS